MNTAHPPLILNFKTMADIQTPDYNYRLIKRAMQDEAVAGWLKSHGYWRTISRDDGWLYDLAEKMSDKPAEFRELFYLLDNYHPNQIFPEDII